MKCSVEFGGWDISGGQQGVTTHGKGWSFSESEESLGFAYQEYTVVGVDVRTTSYVYEGWANDPWPVVIYDISISRKSQFYDIFLIVIVIFGLLSSFPAFMSPEVGERLGYGITFLLIIEVSKMTFVSVLPMCGEILWVDLLFISSELVSLVALAETCVVLFLNYYTHKHIVPPWIFAVGAHMFASLTGREASVGAMLSAEDAALDAGAAEGESVAGLLYRRIAGERGVPPAAERRANPYTRTGSPLEEEDVRKLIFFETLFFQIDENAAGELSFEQASRFLSFAAMHLDPAARLAALSRADSTQDRRLVRWEFVQLCTEHLSATPFDQLELAANNYLSASAMFNTRAQRYWKSVAKQIDMFTRLTLPVAYISWIIFLWHMELSDGYEDAGSKMFAGLGPWTVSAVGVLEALMPLLVLAMLAVSWALSRKYAVSKRYAEAGSTAGKREKKRVRLSMFDAPSAAHARTEAEARGS